MVSEIARALGDIGRCTYTRHAIQFRYADPLHYIYRVYKPRSWQQTEVHNLYAAF